MTDIALPGSIEPARRGPDMDKGFNPLTGILFLGVLAAATLFVAYSIYQDIDASGTKITSYTAVTPALCRAPDRAGLRVREWLP